MTASPANLADETAELTNSDSLDNAGVSALKTVTNPPDNRTWWKEASVYQIYPASFKDSNGDGIGDIPGITSKVDYIKSLGVDVVWVCPIYKSPQIDMGYDISDYEDIDPQYGTLEDVQTLIDECHKRDMKFVMDLVVNHCSDQHKWFQDAISSKNSPYRNWFHWHPGKVVDGKRVPPNNWMSYFSGSAWEWDEKSQEYYLHIFAKEQPDLNWENPDVVKAVHDIMHFWLKRGVDGFRMDVINFISKVPGYPDAPITNKDPHVIYQNGSDHFANGPRLHEFLQGLGSVLKQYNAFSVGEMPCVRDAKEILKAVGFDRGELNMIFHFEIVDMDHGNGGKFSHRDFSLRELKEITKKWQTFMYNNSGWNALYTENHDQSRTVSRYCSDSPEHRVASAKMLATFLTFQAGTPFVYQGQELGMINVPKDWPMSEYKDLESLNHWRDIQKHYKDQPEVLNAYLVEYQKKGRDNARTPMPWSNGANAGFTSEGATPWMKLNPTYDTINAEAQVNDPDSTFFFWKQILAKRKENLDVIVYGNFELVETTLNDDAILAYRRTYNSKEAVVICNWSGNKIERSREDLGLTKGKNWKVLVTTTGNQPENTIKLEPWSAVVFHI